MTVVVFVRGTQGPLCEFQLYEGGTGSFAYTWLWFLNRPDLRMQPCTRLPCPLHDPLWGPVFRPAAAGGRPVVLASHYRHGRRTTTVTAHLPGTHDLWYVRPPFGGCR